MTNTEDIRLAVERLSAGGLVAFPTETVYGLGADAADSKAVARVFATKGRPETNPLIVHAVDEEMAASVTREWPESAKKAAAAFWPGPLTLVLPKAPSVPGLVTAQGNTVAVRVPDHQIALILIGAFGRPIVGPSANPSGYVSPTRAEHVRSHWPESEVLVLDGGPCRSGIESTVLDLTGTRPRILRHGVLGPEELEPVLGPVDIGPPAGEPASASPAASPGLLGPHYRPATPVRLLEDVSDLPRVVAETRGPIVLLSPPGRRVRIRPPHRAIDMPGLASGYARALYSALREADSLRPVEILVVLPLLKDSEIWEAVRERLRRAAS